MSLDPNLPITIAQIIPVFFVIVVFDAIRPRPDVGRPRRWAKSIAIYYRVAAYTLVLLLAFSLVLIADGGQVEDGFAWTYLIGLYWSGALLMIAVASRIDDLADAAKRAPEHQPVF